MYPSTLRSEFSARRRQRIVYLAISHVVVAVGSFYGALMVVASVLAQN